MARNRIGRSSLSDWILAGKYGTGPRASMAISVLYCISEFRIYPPKFSSRESFCQFYSWPFRRVILAQAISQPNLNLGIPKSNQIIFSYIRTTSIWDILRNSELSYNKKCGWNKVPKIYHFLGPWNLWERLRDTGKGIIAYKSKSPLSSCSQ